MKKIISGIFVVIMLFVCCSSLLVEAETLTYDAKAAVEYAAAHWDDGVGKCATFVSNCLKAGGCSAWDSIVGNLLNELITGKWGTYCKTVGTAGKLLSITGNEDIISPGDPLFRVCEKCKNTPHVVICSRIDSSGNIRVYGHNDPQNDELTNWSNLTCSKCNQKCVYYVFHMTDTGKNILGYYYIVNDSEGHNVRSSTSTSANVVGVLPDGEKVLITKYSSDNQWGYVTYGGFSGWTNLSSTYMKFDSVCYEECDHNYSSTSYESTHPHKEYKKCSLCGDIQYTGNTKLVSGCTSCYPPDGYLYKSLDDDTSNPSFPGKWIRSSDSTSGTVIGSVPYGEYAVVTKYNSDKTWAYVKYKGVEGWTKLYESTFPYQDTYYCPVVTFNANGGSVSTSSKKVYLNNPYGTLPTPTRTGYKFDGWYTSASGGSNITSSTNVSLTANQTLYAHWTANQYTITYNANGGSGAPSAQTKTHGTALTLSSTKPSKTGYTFVNWKASDGTTYAPGASYTANASTTLTAQWKANTYTVSYNANGGSGAPSAQTKTHGTALTLSSTKPSKTDYTFVNWKASDGTTYAPGASYTANASTTLTAQWKVNTYTVSYNANGGTGAPASQTKTHGITLELSDKIPARDGYNFLGWSTSASGEVEYAPGDSYTKNESVTLYAVWEEIIEKSDSVALSEISILDSSYNALDSIPSTSFVAEVSVENVSHEGTLTVMLAYYDENGQMLGVRYLYTNPIIGQETTLGASITNTDGKVAKVKAMVFDSLSSFVPLTESVEINK